MRTGELRPLAWPKKRSRTTKVVLVALQVVVVLAGVSIAALTWATDRLDEGITRIADAFPDGDRPNADPGLLTSLVIGLDSAKERQTADAKAISLVRFSEDREHVQVVFLPPDLSSTADTQPGATLAGVFADGGPPELVRAVETMTGVRVDHVVELSFVGFRTVTDALGGVDLESAASSSQPGQQDSVAREHLDGAAALSYVRGDSASSAGTNVGERQQLVIEAWFRRLSELGLLSDLGRLTGTLQEVSQVVSVDSSLTLTELVQLAYSVRNVSEPEFVTAPVAGQGVDGGRAVQFLDEGRAAVLWQYLQDDTLADHLDEFR